MKQISAKDKCMAETNTRRFQKVPVQKRNEIMLGLETFMSELLPGMLSLLSEKLVHFYDHLHCLFSYFLLNIPAVQFSLRRKTKKKPKNLHSPNDSILWHAFASQRFNYGTVIHLFNEINKVINNVSQH